jgi:hypothetical protein
MSRRTYLPWLYEKTSETWQKELLIDQKTGKDKIMGDIFNHGKIFAALMLRSQAPTKPALSVDEEIASLRAREDLNPDEIERLTDLYRQKVGPQKLKTY